MYLIWAAGVVCMILGVLLLLKPKRYCEYVIKTNLFWCHRENITITAEDLLYTRVIGIVMLGMSTVILIALAL